MSVQRIASRYAKSLMDLAVEQNKLERILEDIQSFHAAANVRDFYLMLKSPIINATKKEAIVKAIFSGKYDELTMAFLNIIIKKGREPHLPEIAEEFIAQYRAKKGISSVKLITATPVTSELIAAVKSKLLASGETTATSIEITTEVDPDIIGGFVVEFQDKVYDASIAHKLEGLKKEFTK